MDPAELSGSHYEVDTGMAWRPARFLGAGVTVEPDGTRHDRLEVDAPALIAGQAVSVRVARELARGVVVSELALLPTPSGDIVFLESVPGVFHVTPVRIAARFAGKVRLASGLTPGQKIVTQGGMSLLGESRRPELTQEE